MNLFYVRVLERYLDKNGGYGMNGGYGAMMYVRAKTSDDARKKAQKALDTGTEPLRVSQGRHGDPSPERFKIEFASLAHECFVN